MKTTTSFSGLSSIFFLVIFLLISAQAVIAQSIPEMKLLATDGEATDFFGTSVSIHGDRAIVGAPIDDNEKGYRAGSAYIFERQANGTWQEMQKLVASDGAERNEFGRSVSIWENLAIVGAPLHDFPSPLVDAGAAYLFERQMNGDWVEIAKIAANDTSRVGEFGDAVSIDGPRVLVGSFRDDEIDFMAGGAYIFERQENGSWDQVAKLLARDGALFDNFGRSVSLAGDRALIGSQTDATGNNSGSAYVFERQSDGVWKEVKQLYPNDGAASDFFAESVSISGNKALIGSNRDDDNGIDSGSAYIFERASDGSWSQSQKLLASDGLAYQQFGFSVSLDGYRALVGAYVDDDNGLASGAAYVFEYNPVSGWQEVAKITTSDGVEGDNFGNAVSVSQNYVLAGANRDDDNGDDTGSAYIFELPEILKITSFTLIDAELNQPIPGFDPIPDNTVINLRQLPRFLNIRANTKGHVESVKFGFQGQDAFQLENTPPYALFGNNNGNYDFGRFTPGMQKLTATPFNEDNANGRVGIAKTIQFNVVKEGRALGISHFVLVDADSDSDLFVLNDGDTIDLSSLPSALNVRAEIIGPARSVKMTLQPQGHTQLENVAPFALFGDGGGNYNAGTFEVGTQTLTGTAYTETNAQGRASRSLALALHVIPGTGGVANLGNTTPITLHEHATIPTAFALHSPYPNPFNPTTTLQFEVPESAFIKLTVYDMLGRVVKTLTEGVLDTGIHAIHFEAGSLPSGTYIYVLETPQGHFAEKMLLIK